MDANRVVLDEFTAWDVRGRVDEASTVIGDDTLIDQTTIQHSVILDHCHLERADQVEDSVLGRAVAIKESTNGFRALRVFVSDDSEMTP